MSTVSTHYGDLIGRIRKALGDSISGITADPSQVRPLTGRPFVYIEPPTLEALNYSVFDLEWHVNVVAGTQTTNAAALEEIYNIIDSLAGSGLNIRSAEPTSFSLASTGNLAAYTLVVRQ